MPKYKFTAKNLENKTVKNIMDSRDADDLRKRLRDKGFTLIKYSEVEEKTAGYKMKAGEVAEFSRQIASMLSSGITVVRAMEIIKDRDFKQAVRNIYTRLHKDVQGGITLSEAMRLQSRAFPELFVNMIASGEASGQLESAADKMAVHYEKEDRLNKKIKSAMTYPVLLLCMTVLVVIALFLFILPSFFDLFEGTELPALTAAILNASRYMQSNGLYVLIGVLIFVAFVGYLLTIPKIAYVVDRIKLKMPLFGKLMRTIYTARFSRTLSSLYSSGLSMTNALDISSTILGNRYIQGQFAEVIKDVRNGESLSDSIGKVDGFDKKLTTSILIGEEAGRLDTMLVSVAESFDYEAEMATGQMVQVIEPIMLLVMGVIVGGVMMSVMGPIFTMYDNVS